MTLDKALAASPELKRYYDDEREFAVWERWDECHPIPEGYTLIFGHTPTCYFQEAEPIKIWRSNEAIGIDCACGYFDGRLACLRLDDMKVFYSEENYGKGSAG